ncbi:short-chain dehydrogenase-like protein [Periconia macrospinosa]|uniref:Short-chain dehydrogenase-like protein n=1 Tax=Periconia macrospinosa TaxID=97972 RepID=A0A2V1E2R8_9PLEO|nr:short-chain dehydrogenase-like protein [Periconia macrospinosa]
MTTYLITGSSRGLGLALASLLVAVPNVGKIFASARNESAGIKKLVSESNGLVEFVQLDVTSQDSVQAAASHVEKSLNGKGLDVLVNNAGLMPLLFDSINKMADLESTFQINVSGVHNTTSALLPLLKKGTLKKVINLTSTLGSIGMAQASAAIPTPAYKVAKAALNMLTVQYAQTFAAEDFTFVAVSPGWVKTDLGGDAADLTVEQSSNALLNVVLSVGMQDNGKFLNIKVPGWEDKYDGQCPPW